MRMKLIIIILAFIIIGSPPWSVFAVSENKTGHLFLIERSKNKNLVQYDVHVTGNGDLPDSNPVIAYWILGDGRREELNPVEKKYAYGIASQDRIENNKFRVFLVALEDREIIVEKIKGSFRAVLFIQGKESMLEKVYVESKEGLAGQPQVLYVDLFGKATHTNIPVKERIVP